MKKRRWGFASICVTALIAAMVPAIHTTDVHADQDSASGTATVEFEGGGLVLEQVPNFDFGYHYLGDGQVYSLRTSGASADAATQLGDRSLAVAGTEQFCLGIIGKQIIDVAQRLANIVQSFVKPRLNHIGANN